MNLKFLTYQTLKILFYCSIGLLILSTPSVVLSQNQFCGESLLPPIQINGSSIKYNSTGSVSVYPSKFTSCSVFITPENSFWIGRFGPFTLDIEFEVPIKKIDFLITGTGSNSNCNNEEFLFASEKPGLKIVELSSCFSSINSNTLISGSGCSGSTGGGYFELNNEASFSSIRVSGAGGEGGSILVFCTSSIEFRVDEILSICSTDSVLIHGKFRKYSGFYLDTIKGGSINGEDTVLVTQLIVDTLNVDLGNDTSICPGDSIMYNLNQNSTSIIWEDSSRLPSRNIIFPGYYKVEVSRNNCRVFDEVLINASNNCHLVQFPNVFTPNMDGINDVFSPLFVRGVAKMQTEIFNRWGVSLYKTDTKAVNWEGKGMNPGEYFWKTETTDLFGRHKVFYGQFSLFK